MADQQQNPTQDPGQQQSQRQHESGASRQDQDLSQGSETLDDLQEDHRDHSDTGRGKRGVLDK